MRARARVLPGGWRREEEHEYCCSVVRQGFGSRVVSVSTARKHVSPARLVLIREIIKSDRLISVARGYATVYETCLISLTKGPHVWNVSNVFGSTRFSHKSSGPAASKGQKGTIKWELKNRRQTRLKANLLPCSVRVGFVCLLYFPPLLSLVFSSPSILLSPSPRRAWQPALHQTDRPSNRGQESEH